MSNKPRKTNRASETLAWGTARPKGEKRERERERERESLPEALGKGERSGRDGGPKGLKNLVFSGQFPF